MKVFNLRPLIAFLFALILTIIPLPDFLGVTRPCWVLMLLLFLQCYMPNYFRLKSLFLIGLFLDVLLFSMMGQHAFALGVVGWLANNKARRFSFFPISQQMIFIGFYCLIYQVILVTMDAFFGYKVGFERLLISPLLSALLWPCLRLLCEQSLETRSDLSLSGRRESI